jgi:hypothetical protein
VCGCAGFNAVDEEDVVYPLNNIYVEL